MTEDTRQQATPVTAPVTAPVAAPASAPPQGGKAAKSDKAALPAGDIRTGMSFWNTGTFVAAAASDLVKPVADFAIFFFAAFLIGTLVAGYLTFIRKPPLPLARTFMGTLGLGTAVFGFFLIARLATPEGVGQERGVIAAFVPPVAAVQTAVLPLTPVEKELLTLSTRLSSGDPEARSAAAREALATVEDKPTRRAMLERVLRNSDPNIQQAGIIQALADRSRTALSVIPDAAAPEGQLKTYLTGAQFTLNNVNVATGALTGAFAGGGGNRRMAGSVANGRLILNAQYLNEGRWTDGMVIDLRIDKDFKLVGDVRKPTDAPVRIETPLL